MTRQVDVRAARSQFAKVMTAVQTVDAALTAELQDEIGFVEFFDRVVQPALKNRFRSAAIELLDANLREHWTDRPEVSGAMHLAGRQEALDWIQTNLLWEKALAELLKRGDA